MFFKVFGVQRPPKRGFGGPRRLPRGTHRAPRTQKTQYRNCAQKIADFEVILKLFLKLFWRQNCSKNYSKNEAKKKSKKVAKKEPGRRPGPLPGVWVSGRGAAPTGN